MWLYKQGFILTIKSIVTSEEDYLFLINNLKPLIEKGVAKEIMVQPDMFQLSEFLLNIKNSTIHHTIYEWILPDYIRYLEENINYLNHNCMNQRLNTMPWHIVEVNEHGVVGPSPFAQKVSYFDSITAMIQEYSWLKISREMIPHKAISEKALAYKFTGKKDDISIDYIHILNKAVWNLFRLKTQKQNHSSILL